MNQKDVSTLQAARTQRWIIAEPSPSGEVERLSKDLSIPPSVSRILLQRGIDTFDKAKAFFRPSLELLNDPFLMDGMDQATERILRALKTRERFFVFGDYDVDGTNGASMLALFLREIGAEVREYVPYRIKEGYGVSRRGIDLAHSLGATLFISIDCGITAVSQVDYARELGMDFIICDHHEVGGSLPNAFAVLDPLKPGDSYPFKGLCGCGVGFKLIQGLAQKLGRQDILQTYLEFVTLATTADIVPLNSENRILVKIGLERLNKNPRPGIRALIESAGLPLGRITAGHIVFALAPRINAVGRLGDAMRAVRLLTSADPEESRDLARILEEENMQRRRIDEETFVQAQELADQSWIVSPLPAIVLHRHDWHPGVVGIVASRMSEKYYRPSIMMTTVDGVAKGSARSVPGFDVYRALKRCENTLIQFGGHKYAAGLTAEITRVDEFREAFMAVVDETMPEELRTPAVRIDTEVRLSELTPRFVRILKEFAPFGPGNARPTFLCRDLELAGSPRIVGKNHLRFRAKQDGVTFDAIGFGLGYFLQEVEQARGRKDIQCVFSIDESDHPGPSGGSGEGMVQLKIKDIRTRADDAASIPVA